MRLELTTGSVIDGQFVSENKPVAVATTSSSGIKVTGDVSYFDEFPLQVDDLSSQEKVLQAISEKFNTSSFVQARIISEPIRKKSRPLPVRLMGH